MSFNFSIRYERWIFFHFKKIHLANNKYLNSYDHKQESKHIYLDANSLYGYAMSRFLPTDGFKWIDPKEFDWSKYISNSYEGYVSGVHLAYPNELHKIHNDFPLAPDKIEVKVKMLPSCQFKIADLYNNPIDNVKLTFLIKRNMCFIMRTFNFYLSLGLKLKKYIPY